MTGTSIAWIAPPLLLLLLPGIQGGRASVATLHGALSLPSTLNSDAVAPAINRIVRTFMLSRVCCLPSADIARGLPTVLFRVCGHELTTSKQIRPRRGDSTLPLRGCDGAKALLIDDHVHRVPPPTLVLGEGLAWSGVFHSRDTRIGSVSCIQRRGSCVQRACKKELSPDRSSLPFRVLESAPSAPLIPASESLNESLAVMGGDAAEGHANIRNGSHSFSFD